MIEINSDIVYYFEIFEIVNEITMLIEDPEVFNEKYKTTDYNTVMHIKAYLPKRWELFM